jgi:adenylate cyclase
MMSDVFISYARSSEEQAKQVEEALREAGYGVWRDAELPAHRTYADVIEERLKSAKAVVVLWSAEAAKSQWVRAEADAAREMGTLVQASVDGTVPPMPFNQIQCADLKGWNGGDGSGWQKLSASVAALTGGSTHQSERAKAKRQTNSVCVLPFANMSGDAEQEYFSDGISEDITTDLSKISALAVTARNTAFQFKGQSVDVSDVAKRLGVSHVLEGSVRKAGNRVRITAQLIDGATGDHVWADRYDRDLTDIFQIQDEISKAIVEALKLRLLPEEKKAIEQRGTTSVEAYNLYLMAHNYWVTGNWGDVRQTELVARVCSRAISIDPNYARAWGLLAMAQCTLRFVHSKSPEEGDGLEAAQRALKLDPNLAEAQIVKARHLHEQGRADEARETIRRAIELDPESWEVNHEAAIILYFQRRYVEAARCFEKAVSVVDADFHSWGMLTSVYEVLGDPERVRHAAVTAIADAERALAEDPMNGAALAMGATGLAVLGERERFYEWVDRALMVDPDNQIMAYNFACCMSLRLKDYDRAMDLIERRLETIPTSLFKAALVDPDLAPLREIPRYQEMIERAKARLGMSMAEPPNPAAAS